MSVIILKATDVENHQMGTIILPLCSIAHLFRSKHPVHFCATESDYTNKCLNSRILQKFVEPRVERSPGLHCYVFSDQLPSHFDIATIQTAHQQGVLLWSFPSNTSHFLQPLDDICFACFKSVCYTKTAQLKFSCCVHHQKLYQSNILDIVQQADQEVFSGKVAKRSFANTGVFPFDPSKMRRNVRESVCGEHLEAKTKAGVNSEVVVNLIHSVAPPSKEKNLLEKGQSPSEHPLRP